MQTKAIDRKVAARLLADEDTEAFTLVTIALHELGQDFFTDKPPVIFNELENAFSCKIPVENENKLNAALTVFSSGAFLIFVPVFRTVAAAFDDGDIDDELDGNGEINAPAALWTLFTAGLLLDRELDAGDCSKSVKTLIDGLVAKGAAYNTEEAPEPEAPLFPDEADTMEEVMETKWYEKFIQERTKGLCEELLELVEEKEDVLSFMRERGLTW